MVSKRRLRCGLGLAIREKKERDERGEIANGDDGKWDRMSTPHGDPSSMNTLVPSRTIDP
jgi:hypothetical protein